MFRVLLGRVAVSRSRFFCSGREKKGEEVAVVLRKQEAKRKSLDQVLDPAPPKSLIKVDTNQTIDISGVPLEHRDQRSARIFQRTREATQSGWNNTKPWKIELDNRQRWDNPLMGWASSGDPLSNISMNLDFASKEDAMRFCEKNHWHFEVEEQHERLLKPKAYGSNFSWNKRTRVATK